jgi:hypothetical protein
VKAIGIISVVTLVVTFGGCSKGDLRGKSVRSPDAKTYLVVDHDNGGACGSIMIDGREWPHAIHSAGEIAPGLHKIACGDPNYFIEFEVKPGTTFHFDYWGP